jgi:hypothetical protein
MAKKQSSKVQPIEQIRLGGIKAAIWKNEGKNGAWFNVTLQRIYKSEEGAWSSSGNFGRDDLLLLAKVANAVHTRVLQLIADERAGKLPVKPAA